MMKELQCHRVFEIDFGIDVKTNLDEVYVIYFFMFLQFHHDLDGLLELEKFKLVMKRIRLVMADELGLSHL